MPTDKYKKAEFDTDPNVLIGLQNYIVTQKQIDKFISEGENTIKACIKLKAQIFDHESHMHN
jgi:hypothetical protein